MCLWSARVARAELSCKPAEISSTDHAPHLHPLRLCQGRRAFRRCASLVARFDQTAETVSSERPCGWLRTVAAAICCGRATSRTSTTWSDSSPARTATVTSHPRRVDGVSAASCRSGCRPRETVTTRSRARSPPPSTRVARGALTRATGPGSAEVSIFDAGTTWSPESVRVKHRALTVRTTATGSAAARVRGRRADHLHGDRRGHRPAVRRAGGPRAHSAGRSGTARGRGSRASRRRPSRGCVAYQGGTDTEQLGFCMRLGGPRLWVEIRPRTASSSRAPTTTRSTATRGRLRRRLRA